MRRTRSLCLVAFLFCYTVPVVLLADEKGKEPAKPKSAFPDKALEDAVRAEVFAKRYNREPITAADVKNISRVVARGKGIKSLEGLQHCQALMLIDLNRNGIEDLSPIKNLKRLQSVSLANNQITNIQPLVGCEKMQLLDLSGNQVSDLSSLTAMQNLRTLYVADNKVTDLTPLKDLKKIWSLDASGNPIGDLTPVASLQWLTSLNLQSCKLSDLSALKPLGRLNMLQLQDNLLADLTPLVAMCQTDAAGPKRFAAFLRLYLDGNPVAKDSENAQLQSLTTAGVRLDLAH